MTEYIYSVSSPFDSGKYIKGSRQSTPNPRKHRRQTDCKVSKHRTTRKANTRQLCKNSDIVEYFSYL